MDDLRYLKKQDEMLAEHEALCKRCGFCCGAGTDEPCSNLRKEDNGYYYCASYEDRIGLQFTVSGRPFTCVPIGDVLRYGLPHGCCGYAGKQETI